MDPAQRQAVLYLPPFAEEMNRSRRMSSQLANVLAAEGVGTLILDPFGTGDSAGDFADATWQGWCGDAQAACLWLQVQGYEKISIVGLRLGACLALQAASAPALAGMISKTVLWQPVLKGSTFLSQFIRIRVAAGMSDVEGGTKETVKDLRAQLSAGEALEIAGYPLTGEMAAAVDALDLHDLIPDGDLSLAWCEMGSGPDPSPASAKIIERLRARGQEVDIRVLPGEPFWSIEETTLVPALWQETAALVAGV